MPINGSKMSLVDHRVFWTHKSTRRVLDENALRMKAFKTFELHKGMAQQGGDKIGQLIRGLPAKRIGSRSDW